MRRSDVGRGQGRSEGGGRRPWGVVGDVPMGGGGGFCGYEGSWVRWVGRVWIWVWV